MLKFYFDILNILNINFTQKINNIINLKLIINCFIFYFFEFNYEIRNFISNFVFYNFYIFKFLIESLSDLYFFIYVFSFQFFLSCKRITFTSFLVGNYIHNVIFNIILMFNGSIFSKLPIKPFFNSKLFFNSIDNILLNKFNYNFSIIQYEGTSVVRFIGLKDFSINFNNLRSVLNIYIKSINNYDYLLD
jgi:hypothetical protein